VSERKDPDALEGKRGNGDAAPDEPTGLAGVNAEPLPPASRGELERLRQENDDLRDQLVRRRADFENFRKRTERDRAQAGVEAVAALFKALIPSLDNLDRALEADASDASLREGVELIRRELLALLEAQGVTREDPVGEMFDPERHQALAHEPAPGRPEGSILEVFRKGYRLRDRLLRPAMVKVAGGGGAENGSEAVH